MSNLIETRALPGSVSEVRANAGRTVTGYAIIFNRFSRDLGGFKEIILPEAINGVIEKSDIFALLNHDSDRGILARCTNGKGSLKLSIDQKGVKYSFEAPRFPLGEEVLEGLRRGEIVGSSFSFTCDADGDYMERGSTGEYIRVITQINQLYDVSPVHRPAYTMTSVGIAKFERSSVRSRTPGEYKKYIDSLIKQNEKFKLMAL